MLFICFAGDDHVVEDTLGVRYSLQNLVYGTLPDRRARGDAKNQPIVFEVAFVRANCEVLLRLLRHFHLVISLAQIQFATMLSPGQISKISSMRGRGYCSARRTGLTETLKSPQTRTDPLRLTTGTIGVAHSLYSTLDRIPSFPRRVNSASTLGRSAYGTWRGL